MNMRFTYELYKVDPFDTPWVRAHTCTRFEEILKEKASLPIRAKWKIGVYDNLKQVELNALITEDDIDNWCETRDRDIWRSKEVKDAEKTALSRNKWNAFDEKETEIHMKDTHQDYSIRLSTKLAENTTCDTSGTHNVKNIAAIGKPQTSAVPPVAILALGAAMQNGADKYGTFNWRSTEVTASVFYDAIMRHLLAWYSGENYASDSKIHHLAHAMAGCAILLDAELSNVFNDNRNTKIPEMPSDHYYKDIG